MKDLRETLNAKKLKSNFSLINWIIKNKKTIIIIILILLVLNILFNPVKTATVVSNWINDFIGTLIHNTKL